MDKLTIVFCDAQPAIVYALEQECRRRVASEAFRLAEVNRAVDFEFRCADILGVDADGFAVPGNSFGWLNGGVDAVFMQRDPDLQRSVFECVKMYDGEVLIGRTYAIRATFGLFIGAPTMRVPASDVSPLNCFLAARAAFQTVKQLQRPDTPDVFKVNRVAIPGFGTGAGGLRLDLAAAAMLGAVEDAFTTTRYGEWQEAFRHQQQLLRPYPHA